MHLPQSRKERKDAQGKPLAKLSALCGFAVNEPFCTTH